MKPAAPATPALLLETPRVRSLAAGAVFVTAVALIGIAWPESSAPRTAAPEAQALIAEQEAPVSYATSRATPSGRATDRATVLELDRSEPASKPAMAEPVSETTLVASTAAVTTQEAQAITITGCLEQDNETYRLKDTDGLNVPQSRSWKAGFLARRNRSVDVVDSSNRFKLSDHVGERVSATGTLIDGDIQLRSLRRVSASCDDEA